MHDIERVRTATRRTRLTIIAALVGASGTLTGIVGCQSVGSALASASAAGFPAAAPPGDLHLPPGPFGQGLPRLPSGMGAPSPPLALRPALGRADGVVPGGMTVFNNGLPAVANLAPALLAALRQATKEAANDDVVIFVNSGWRSPKYQMHLFREAVTKYGSAREAARWVATPETSPHVSGDAVDIGPSRAAAWLSEHGARYGLCQIYRNEPWHFELRPGGAVGGCPPMYTDATHDPRLQ